MKTHRQIGEFNLQWEDWMSCSKRLEEYLIANEIKSAKKKNVILLSVVGTETYQFIEA